MIERISGPRWAMAHVCLVAPLPAMRKSCDRIRINLDDASQAERRQ